MARKVNVLMICDLPYGHKNDAEAEDAETFNFGWGTASYEIDLCPKDGKQAEDMTIGTLLQYARKVAGRGIPRAGQHTTAPASGRSAASREQRADVRRWAIANGYKVSDRGRIAASITADYEKAHDKEHMSA